jgi:hypothetical protein
MAKKQTLNTVYSWFSVGSNIGYAPQRGKTSCKSQIARPGHSQLPEEGKNDPGAIG